MHVAFGRVRRRIARLRTSFSLMRNVIQKWYYANAIWEESVRFGCCERNREKRGRRGTGTSANRCLLRKSYECKRRNNARRIWSSTPQNCATTNQFFVNEKRLFRNGITQTPFGKKASALDAASETVKREVAEARGPRRTGACCVSPKKNYTPHGYLKLHL